MIRNLQIIPEIPTLATNSNLRHVATSYEISYAPYFENTDNSTRDEESIIVSNLEDADNPLVWYYDIPNLEENTDIYVRYRLHYEKITSSGIEKVDFPWSTIINVKGDQEGFKVADVVVKTPVLTLEELVTNVNRRVLRMTSSEMQIFKGYGDHIATSWEVMDTDGKVLWTRDKSPDLLTSIDLVFDMFAYNKVYLIRCKHHTNKNGESYWGTFVYNQGLDKQDMYRLYPTTDLVSNRYLGLQIVLDTPRFISLDFILKDRYNNMVATEENVRTLDFKVMMPKLITGAEYFIWSRMEYEPGQYTEWRLDTSMIAKGNNIIDKDPSLVYETEYQFCQKLIQPGVKWLYSKELLNGGFLIPKSETEEFKGLGYYILQAGQLVYVSDVLGTESGGVKPLSNWNTNIVPLYNDCVMVNRTEIASTEDHKGLGQSVWLKYEMGISGATLELKAAKTMELQFGATGISGSALATLDNNIWYVPCQEGVDSSHLEYLKLYKLDTETMESKMITPLPFFAHRFVSLCPVTEETFLVAGGMLETTLPNPKDWERSNNDVYLYNIKDNSFTLITTLPNYMNKWYNMHMVLLKNGTVAIFNQSEGEGVAEDQSVVILNVDAGTVSNLANDFEDGRPYLRTLVAKDGCVYRISSSEYEPQMMYVYKVKGYPTISNGEADIVTSVVTELVVPENTVVNIDNPYKYTKITILGSKEEGTSGTLRWLSKNHVREFQSDTIFITKTMVLYNNTVDDLTKDQDLSNIVLLDGVDFDITNADKD